MISISVLSDSRDLKIDIPTGIGLNLMEVLKASGLPIPGTCGGMALCATCRIAILSGETQIPPAGDAEQDMLDKLPYSDETIRLSCQISVNGPIDNMRIKLIGD